MFEIFSEAAGYLSTFDKHACVDVFSKEEARTIIQVPTTWLAWFGRDCGKTTETLLFRMRACDCRTEKRRGMRTTPGITRTALRTGQACIECVPFSVSLIVVCVSVAAIENVVCMMKVEIGAHAPISFCALLLLALLLPGLTLMGLARFAGLQSLVGLTTRLATSTA